MTFKDKSVPSLRTIHALPRNGLGRAGPLGQPLRIGAPSGRALPGGQFLAPMRQPPALAEALLKSLGPTSFLYEMTAVPATHAYGPAGYSGKDIEGLLQIEHNVFELVTNLHPGGLGVHLLSSGAVGLGAGKIDYRPKGIFRQVSIRGNVVRHVDNELDWPNITSGFDVDNGGVVLLSHNVFAIDQASPIQFHWCELVSCVNNLTVQGTLVSAYDKVTGRSAQLYFPAAEDALILAL